jgi:hypothetical protein
MLFAATAAFATVVVISSCMFMEYWFKYLIDLPENSYPKEEYLKFTKGSLEEMTSYLFGKRVNPHYFCPTCGSGPLEASTRPGLFGVNIRSVAGGIDWSKLKIQDLDGASR